MMQRKDDPYKTIREFPVGLFWSRENGLSPEEAHRQFTELQMMPVAGTGYLLNDDIAYLIAVPYRHRN